MHYILLFLLIITLPASAHVINIPDDFETIQEGIDEAEDGDTVLVAPGEYVENLSIRNLSITLIGDSENPEDVVIDGNEDGSVIRVDGFNEDNDWHFVLRGFTIQNGEADDGGGLLIGCSRGTIELSDLIVRDNHASEWGGGMYIFSEDSSRITVRNTQIINNEADYDEGGGGANISGTYSDDILFDNILFSENIGPAKGTGLSLNYCNAKVQNCEFLDNNLFFLHCLENRVENVLIAGRNDNEYAGLTVWGIGNIEGFAEISNVTIIGASAGMQLMGPYQMTVKNSIVWDIEHTPMLIIAVNGGAPELIIEYCSIEGGENGVRGDEFEWGEGNIDEDPLLADPENGDYHLSIDSPCIDAGDPDSPPDPDSSRADMGAYYFHQQAFVENPDTLWFGYDFNDSTDNEITIRNGYIRDLWWWLEFVPEDVPFLNANVTEGVLAPKDDASIILTVNTGGLLSDTFFIASLILHWNEDSLVIPIYFNTLDVELEELNSPATFAIQSIHPNPFNSSTRITYSLDRAGYSNLSIFDLAGRRVETLFSGSSTAGKHDLTWDGSHLPAGIYLLRLENGFNLKSAKLILIK